MKKIKAGGYIIDTPQEFKDIIESLGGYYTDEFVEKLPYPLFAIPGEGGWMYYFTIDELTEIKKEMKNENR